LKYKTIKEGNYVMKQGDYGDTFYIILKGSVEILVNTETPFEWRCEPVGSVSKSQVERGIQDFISEHLIIHQL
jgi:CRP-like cAMP-binding protein